MPSEDVSIWLRLRNGLAFKRGMNDAAASTRRMGTAAKSSSRSMMALDGATRRTNKALLAGARAARGYAALGLVAGAYEAKRMLKASSDMREEINKTNVVFRGGQSDILAWSKNAHRTMVMSQEEAIASANTFGAMLVPMGFARDRALGMAKALTRLSADMGSLHNVDPNDMMEKMRSGMAGMSRPLRAYGVDLRATAMQEFIASKGVRDKWATMKGASKTMWLYRKILADTAKQGARGDVARTLHETANQQRELRAQFLDLEATLGDKLEPTYRRFLNTATTWLGQSGRTEQITRGLSDGFDTVGRTAKTAYRILKPFAGVLWSIKKPLAAMAGAWIALSIGMGAIRKMGRVGKALGMGRVLGRAGFGGERGSMTNPMFVVVVNGPGGRGGKVANIAKRAAPWATSLGSRAASLAMGPVGLVGALAGAAWFLGNHGPTKGTAHGTNPLTGRPYTQGPDARRNKRNAHLVGGLFPGHANGGLVQGQGYGDSVLRRLTPGEYVVRREAVQAIGTQRLQQMNHGVAPAADVVVPIKLVADGRVFAEVVHRHVVKAKALR